MAAATMTTNYGDPSPPISTSHSPINGYPPSRSAYSSPASPVDPASNGRLTTPLAPPPPPPLHLSAHRHGPGPERQVRYAGADHTLGPTFSEEEDGDDSAFIAAKMAALGLDPNGVPYAQGGYTGERERSQRGRERRSQTPTLSRHEHLYQHQNQQTQQQQQQQQALINLLSQQGNPAQTREVMALLELQQAQQAATDRHYSPLSSAHSNHSQNHAHAHQAQAQARLVAQRHAEQVEYERQLHRQQQMQQKQLEQLAIQREETKRQFLAQQEEQMRMQQRERDRLKDMQMREMERQSEAYAARAQAQAQASARAHAQAHAQAAAQAQARQRAALAAQMQANFQVRNERQGGQVWMPSLDDAELKARFESAHIPAGHMMSPPRDDRSRFDSGLFAGQSAFGLGGQLQVSPATTSPTSPSWPSQSSSPTKSSSSSSDGPAPANPPANVSAQPKVAPGGRFAQARLALAASGASSYGTLTASLAKRSASEDHVATQERSVPAAVPRTTPASPTTESCPVVGLGIGHPRADSSGAVRDNEEKVRLANYPHSKRIQVKEERSTSQPVGKMAKVHVARQPLGPPGDVQDLGDKNFQARIRKQAGINLGMLGRRVDTPAEVGIVA